MAQMKWNGLKMAQTKMKWPKNGPNEMKWPKNGQKWNEMAQDGPKQGRNNQLEYARENIEKPNVWIGTISCF